MWFASGIGRSFGLKELDEPWLQIGLNRRKTSFAISVNTLGWSQMRQYGMLAGFGYAAGDVALKTGVEYRKLSLDQPYRNDQALMLHLGLEKRVDQSLLIHASGANFAGGKWLQGGDPVERILTTGLMYRLPQPVLMSGGVAFSDVFAPDIHAHLYWMPHADVSLHLGTGTVPTRVEVGIAIRRGGWLAGSGFTKITRSAIGWRQQHWVGRVVS